MLRIPMWGYESIPTRIAQTRLFCYESPCGVMSGALTRSALLQQTLRIPMWGYELELPPIDEDFAYVTNPHVGL